VDDNANGLADAAFSFGPGCHAHRFPMSIAAAGGDGRSSYSEVRDFTKKRQLFRNLERNRAQPLRVSADPLPCPDSQEAPCGVLDRCSQARNQARHKNFLNI
jgi:hypothetical protein